MRFFKMKCAFVCWRPYQVLNSVNFILNNVEECAENSDLFLQNIPSLSELTDNLSKAGLFRNVFLFDEKNRGDGSNVSKSKMFFLYLVKTKDFLFPGRAIKKNCQKIDNFRNQYDKVFSSGWISFNTELINCNRRAEVVMFEDGFSSYVNNELSSLSKPKKIYFNILNRLFKKGLFSFSVDRLYVYNPDAIIIKRNVLIKKMPEITSQSHCVLCHIFYGDADISIYDKKSIVYLDQPLNQFTKQYDSYLFTDRLESLPYFVYRPHPLQKKSNICCDHDEPNCVMWEISVKNISNESWLISPYSTALITPFLLYKKAPNLIFLFKLLLSPETEIFRFMEQFIEKMKALYPSKIYVPKSIEEYNNVISIILQSDLSESN